MIIKRRLTFWLITLLALFAASPAFAQLSFLLTTGKSSTNTQDMTFDSNQCPSRGPISAWVGGTITNSGGSTVTGISATLSGLASGFSLVYASTATQSLGSLGSGEKVSVFWHIAIPCTDLATTTPTLSITSSGSPASVGLTLIAKKAISANAGGNVISATLGPGAVVGQIVNYDTNYTFGSSSTNDEVFLQPAGNTTFNSECFRLTRSEVTASAINGITVGTIDKLYFVSTSSNGNGSSVSVRYSFQYLCANTSTVARPFAQLTSGTQLKYTGNYDGTGSVSVSYPGATNPFTITKTASETSLLSTSTHAVTYTVTISNPSTNPTFLGSVTDTLPANVTYSGIAAGSDVTVANSSSTPATGATGTIKFTGKLNQSYALAAGGSVVLKYTAIIPATAGSYINSAYGTFGTSTTTPTATATITVSNPQTLIVSKISLAYSDPVNATTNPKMIPGAFVTYLISVQNPNIVALGTDSVVVTDPTAIGLTFFAGDFGASGSGPVVLADGSPTSALTFSYLGLASQTDDVDFSNDGGATWTYVPVPGADGTDASVSVIRMRPKGAMAPGSSFAVSFRYRIN